MKNGSDCGTKPSVAVLCDFDGTASAIDVGHHLLKALSGDQWEAIDADYCNGVIGSMAAYQKIAEAITATPEAFYEALQSLIRLDPGFPDFFEFCKDRGYALKIVSDGLDYYIGKILERYRLSDIPFYANRLLFAEDGTIAIDFPMSNPSCRRCGTCKRSILEACRVQFDRIVYIGDGHSDICPSRFADLVFAKQILYRHSCEKGLPCIHFSDFSEIHKYMENGCHEALGALSYQRMGCRGKTP